MHIMIDYEFNERGKILNKRISKLIKNYIKEYEKRDDIESNWKEAIVDFADANDPLFEELKDVVSPSHALPQDILSDAKSVIAYFIPFAESIANSNIDGKYSSKGWAKAYVETNQLISDINDFLKNELTEENYKLSTIPATSNFDKENLMSDWSHRHVAYIAGLGTFGVNNMLITEKGCAGRIGTIVTNIDLEASKKIDKERCLTKAGYSCNKCVDRCVANALSKEDFDRYSCYDLLLENDSKHPELALTDVCGKCNVGLPCSFKDPTP